MNREHWRVYIAGRCILSAILCKLVPEGTGRDELGKLPAHVIEVAQAKVHQLVKLAMSEDKAGESRLLIGQEIETQLWRLLYDFKPAGATPQSSNGVNPNG